MRQGKVEERICPSCGFHVVGRTKRNRCPECSGDLSATAGLLQFSDAGWLRTLANGMFLTLAGVAGAVCGDCDELAGG